MIKLKNHPMPTGGGGLEKNGIIFVATIRTKNKERKETGENIIHKR